VEGPREVILQNQNQSESAQNPENRKDKDEYKIDEFLQDFFLDCYSDQIEYELTLPAEQ